MAVEYIIFMYYMFIGSMNTMEYNTAIDHCPVLVSAMAFITTNTVYMYLPVLRAASMVNPLVWPTTPRDAIRETTSRCSTVIHGTYIYYFIILILSETLLFMVLF